MRKCMTMPSQTSRPGQRPLVTPVFPTAMRAINALAPAHASAPQQVVSVAQLLENSMQSYGRCVLASSHGGGSGSPSSRDKAVREAEDHMIWRGRVRAAINALEVDGRAPTEAVVNARRELDRLAYTIDRVLACIGVHCVAVASGLRD